MATPVDFDYSGPPVSVSNGMALQLVVQFGVRSAWHAFLRMRGMKLGSEEANRAVDSFNYFRNKIAFLRRSLNEVEEEREETGEKAKRELMAADFDTFLVASDSVELRPDVDRYPEVDERDFEEQQTKKEGEEERSTLGDEATGASDADHKNDYLAEQSAAATLIKVVKEKQQKITQQQFGGTEKQHSPAESGRESAFVTDIREGEGNSKDERRYAEDEMKEGGEEEAHVSKHQQKEWKKEEIARRHAETIDDVVSLVMEKIRNNQPFEGELTMTTSIVGPQAHVSTAGSKCSEAITTKGQRGLMRTAVGTKRGTGRREAHMMEIMYGGRGSGLHQTSTLSQQQQHIAASTSNLGSPLCAIPSGQSFVLLHSSAGSVHQASSSSFSSSPQSAQTAKTNPAHATSILSNFSEIIRASSSPTTSSSMVPILPIHNQQHFDHPGGTQEAPSAITAKLSTQKCSSQHSQSMAYPPRHQMISSQTAYPQQSQQLMIGAETGAEIIDGIGIPLEVAIQQGMTVQELIQTLKTQSRQLHQPQHQNQTLVLSNQQETPDSSSQEATQQDVQKLDRDRAVMETIKGRKRKDIKATSTKCELMKVQRVVEEEDQPKMKKQRKKGGKQQLLMNVVEKKGSQDKDKMEGGVSEWAKKRTGRRMTRTKHELTEQQQFSPTTSTAAPIKTDSTQAQQNIRQHVDDLGRQLKRAQKQLRAEHNKVAIQMKRVDKLQAELDKAQDSIQLLQIDLACQKTDNNLLIAENIALKAENQHLRSKGSSTLSATRRISSSSAIEASSTTTTTPRNAGKGRKKGSEKRVSQKKAKDREKQAEGPEKKRTTPPLSSEFGRRQSKRICVARNQYLKTFYK